MCSRAENIKKARRAFFLYGNIGTFQGDSNTAAVIIMGFQSVQYRILERKLGFLQRVLDWDSRSEWQGGGGSES